MPVPAKQRHYTGPPVVDEVVMGRFQCIPFHNFVNLLS